MSLPASTPSARLTQPASVFPQPLCLMPLLASGDKPAIRDGVGKKLHQMKSSFSDVQHGLAPFGISIDTPDVQAHNDMHLSTKKKVIDEHFLEFVHAPWVNKPDSKVLRFNLLKDIGYYRNELAHRNKLGMNTHSLYSFNIRFGYGAKDFIFFQLKETGGALSRGKPAISLHMHDENTIRVHVNDAHGRVVSQNIARMTCGNAWYQFRIKVIWHRSHPLVQISVNNQLLFVTQQPFGAANTRQHYSKYGIYIPQQKTKPGVKDTSLLLDNVSERHRRFIEHNVKSEASRR